MYAAYKTLIYLNIFPFNIGHSVASWVCVCFLLVCLLFRPQIELDATVKSKILRKRWTKIKRGTHTHGIYKQTGKQANRDFINGSAIAARYYWWSPHGISIVCSIYIHRIDKRYVKILQTIHLCFIKRKTVSARLSSVSSHTHTHTNVRIERSAYFWFIHTAPSWIEYAECWMWIGGMKM